MNEPEIKFNNQCNDHILHDEESARTMYGQRLQFRCHIVPRFTKVHKIDEKVGEQNLTPEN